MREVIMAGDYWCIPPKGGSRAGRPSTNWLIETANQAWKKYRLHDPTTLIKCLQDKRKKKKNKKTPEQIKEAKMKRQLKARVTLRDYLEDKRQLEMEGIKELIQKAFKKWEINACRSIQHDTDQNTILLTLLNKYHEADEEESNRRHQEQIDKT